MPPLLLNNLPRLPDNLQYRFYGRSVVMLDGDAADHRRLHPRRPASALRDEVVSFKRCNRVATVARRIAFLVSAAASPCSCAGAANRRPRRRPRARPGRGAADAPAAPPSTLPKEQGSVKFLVIGDTGTGGSAQYQVGQRIVEARKQFPFEFAIMMGDNLYGTEGPSAYVNKFEKPYKPLLDAGVKFYATLGNHDEPSQRFYKPFNMDGKRYYSFRKGDVEFFVARQHLHDAGAGGLAEGRAREVRCQVEDSVLPSPDLLVGREARLGARPAAC